jgi:hypothetical protein
MAHALIPPTPRVPYATVGAPRSMLRTDPVLARFPMPTLTTGGTVTMRITQTTAQGALDLRWVVSSKASSGPPRPLASQRETLVICPTCHHPRWWEPRQRLRQRQVPS